jgi:hypothetical protein
VAGKVGSGWGEKKRLLAKTERRVPGVKVPIRKLSDFGDAIRAEGADLPVVRADMPDTWVDGPRSDPAGAAIARTVRPRIAVAETFEAVLEPFAPAPYILMSSSATAAAAMNATHSRSLVPDLLLCRS